MFLHALAAQEAGALAAWAATDRPDDRWASWLHGQGLAPFIFHRLRQTGALVGLSQAFTGPLQEAYYRAAGDAELHTRELATALDALIASGVTATLFKGAALAYTAYPDPACRPMGDLDLWLDVDEMPHGRAALEAAGYQVRHKATRPHALQAERDGEVQLIGRAPGSGLVELHYGVFAGEWLRRTAAIDRAGIRARIVPATILGHPVYTLAPEDAIIQLAVHLSVNHQMAYPGLRGLLDIVLLAQAAPVDWELVAERARVWRVAAAVWLPLALADALFGLSAAAGQAVKRLRPAAPQRWLLGRFANAASLLAGRDLTRGPLRLVYQLILVDRPRDAIRLLWRALWPEDDWLAARYGATAFGVRVRHLLDAGRGRV